MAAAQDRIGGLLAIREELNDALKGGNKACNGRLR